MPSVKKPQHEVLLRQGPCAGQLVWVDIDVDAVLVDGHRYTKDPVFADYFVHEPLHEERGP